jgi:phycocyanin-associated rod protein
MLGQSTGTASNRFFVYEVSGLRQTEESGNNAYDFRRSGSVFLKVPYARMNEEMRRISRLGGTILDIKPYSASEGA